MLEDFKLILPEFLLVVIVLIGQLSSLFIRNQKLIIRFFLPALSLLIIYILKYSIDYANPIYYTMDLNNSLVFIRPEDVYYKSIILFLSILIIIFYKSYCDIKSVKFQTEFITLFLLSVLGIMLLISSQNFILWFCGLELQALTSYVLAAFNTNSKISSEAGLKYFILGALISCIAAFGISFTYGFSGNLNFGIIVSVLNNIPLNIGLLLGITFVLITILFKLSAVPFHFWTPDVYEGSPIYSLAYFSTISKYGFLIVLINFLAYFVGNNSIIILKLLKIVSVLSMVLGALGALQQKSIKRLLAYSAILNTGYSLIGLCTHTAGGYHAALVNMFIYVTSLIGLLSCFMASTSKNIDNLTFDDIQGLATSKKAIAAVISIIMFSLVGVPPLAGFFGKYYLFSNAIQNGEYLLAIIGIVTSVISAFYYLKIIKTLYFMDNVDNYERIPTQRGLLFITMLSTLFIILFSLFKISI